MSNTYSNLLSDLIDKSGLSLTELSQKADEEHGQKITPSYLSKLKNGKMPPPSFKVSIALALALGVEPELLLAAGVAYNNESDKEELEKSLKELYPNMDYGDLMEKVWRISLVPNEIINPPINDGIPSDKEIAELYKNSFSSTEQFLINESNLSLESLKERYNLEIDGETASDEEIEKMIEYIKIYRLMKKNQNS